MRRGTVGDGPGFAPLNQRVQDYFLVRAAQPPLRPYRPRLAAFTGRGRLSGIDTTRVAQSFEFMPKRGIDADSRIFFDEVPSVYVSRLRALGTPSANWKSIAG
jgi:hypothetical protein